MGPESTDYTTDANLHGVSTDTCCMHMALPTHRDTHTNPHTQTVLSGWSIVSCAGEGWWLQTAVKALRTRGWHPLSSERGEMSNIGDLSLPLSPSFSLPPSLIPSFFSFNFQVPCSSLFLIVEDSFNNSHLCLSSFIVVINHFAPIPSHSLYINSFYFFSCMLTRGLKPFSKLSQNNCTVA